MCKFYHWTTSDRLAYIAREGLLPRGQIERRHGRAFIQYPHYTKPGLVYLLEGNSDRYHWGDSNNRPKGYRYAKVLLCVDPPKPAQNDAHFNQPHLDEFYRNRPERTHPGRIPPERIRVHRSEGCVPISEYVSLQLAQAA